MTRFRISALAALYHGSTNTCCLILFLVSCAAAVVLAEAEEVSLT